MSTFPFFVLVLAVGTVLSSGLPHRSSSYGSWQGVRFRKPLGQIAVRIPLVLLGRVLVVVGGFAL